ncbi:MAG: NADH-quinone oxidoreductase subunit N [Verrucomicrobia bacterium]|nr:NADH-quinone oxidoreductase subunit N [Verrucomicrobiota bacterium]
MSSVDYFQLLKLVAPEAVMALGALAVLAVDLLFMRCSSHHQRQTMGAFVAGLGCLGALLCLLQSGESASLFGGMLVVDPLTRMAKAALLILTVFTIILSIERTFSDHVGEYYALILLATIGMMFLVSSEELLMIFVSLELTSLSLYILTAFHKRSAQSAEAALKYFLFGGMAAAFTLFGISLVYGLSGATGLREIAVALEGKELDAPMALALVMTVTGFGFKIAVVPFHLWAPDAYQGAPTPTAALVASGSKVASFFVLAKVLMIGFSGFEGDAGWRHFVSGWAPILAVLALLSMFLGNLAAIAQSSVRRLLAYSAIAHSGYALLGILSNSERGFSSLMYYMVTYALTAIGAFGVVAIVEERKGGSRLSDFAGLGRESPLVGLSMMIFMLSLAGIPPLAGFFGKFYVFVAAVGSGSENSGLLWLVIVAIAMSAVSLYYYLQVLKQIFVADETSEPSVVREESFTNIAICGLAVLVVILGCAPNLLVAGFDAAVRTAGFK